MKIEVKNKTRRSLVYNLSHKDYCIPQGACECTKRNVRTYEHNGATGATKLRSFERTFPPVLTLRPLEKRAGLPEEIQKIPVIKTGLENRDLQVISREGESAGSPGSPPVRGRTRRREE